MTKFLMSLFITFVMFFTGNFLCWRFFNPNDRETEGEERERFLLSEETTKYMRTHGGKYGGH